MMHSCSSAAEQTVAATIRDRMSDLRQLADAVLPIVTCPGCGASIFQPRDSAQVYCEPCEDARAGGVRA